MIRRNGANPALIVQNCLIRLTPTVLTKNQQKPSLSYNGSAIGRRLRAFVKSWSKSLPFLHYPEEHG
jgi:hypothetical protein